MKMSGATDFSFSRVMEWNRIWVAPVTPSSVRGTLRAGPASGVAGHVDGDGDVGAVHDHVVGHRIDIAAVDQHAPVEHHRAGRLGSASWRPAPGSAGRCRERPARWRRSRRRWRRRESCSASKSAAHGLGQQHLEQRDVVDDAGDAQAPQRGQAAAQLAGEALQERGGGCRSMALELVRASRRPKGRRHRPRRRSRPWRCRR